MPTLKKTTETVFRVDYEDFEKFVNECYGFEPTESYGQLTYPYSFVEAEEASNYANYDYKVSPEIIDSEELEELQSWIDEGGHGWVNNYVIFLDLCNKGLLEPGTYIISVFW